MWRPSRHLRALQDHTQVAQASAAGRKLSGTKGFASRGRLTRLAERHPTSMLLAQQPLQKLHTCTNFSEADRPDQEKPCYLFRIVVWTSTTGGVLVA